MTLLSIDPGKRIGWALFDRSGNDLGRGVMDFDLFSHSIHYKPQLAHNKIIFTPRGTTSVGAANGPQMVDDVVFESYYLDPGVKQGGSTGPAQEVIGVVKYLCLQAGIEWAEQRSAILPVAKVHHGYEQTKSHLPDEDSAWLHGRYRLVAEGVVKPLSPTGTDLENRSE